MVERDARVIYAKGAMEDDRDTGKIPMRNKDKGNETELGFMFRPFRCRTAC